MASYIESLDSFQDISLEETTPVPDPETRQSSRTTTQVTLSLHGVEDCSLQIQDMKLLVLLDHDLIEESRKARESLDKDQRISYNQQLGLISANTSGDTIRALVAKGADPNCNLYLPKPENLTDPIRKLGLASIPLGAALEVGNNECLAVLLQCGSDPNAQVLFQVSNDRAIQGPCYQTALAHAAWMCNEEAVWALVAAGARVNPNQDDQVPDNHHLCGSYKFQATEADICSTPLLRALAPKGYELLPDKGKMPRNQDRIVRFLLANGADPNGTSCRHFGAAGSRRPPLFTAMVVWLPLESKSPGKALSVFNSLLKAGALPVFDDSNWYTSRSRVKNPFNAAAEHGQHEMLTSLSEHIARSQNVSRDLWKHAISYAVREKHWQCCDVLAKPPYADATVLHQLVNDYMASDRFIRIIYSRESFMAAAGRLVRSKLVKSPDVRARFEYTKRRSLMRKSQKVLERLSPIELADNIKTDMDRRVIWNFLFALYRDRMNRLATEQ